MVIKNDPGAPVIWLAFLCLISGLCMTFYLPRRRAWIRLDGDVVRMAMLGDRYVDLPRELDRLLDDLGARAGRPVAELPAPVSRLAGAGS